MAKFDRIDLSGLHREIMAAKGGTFGAVTLLPPRSDSALRRLYGRLLDVPGLGAAARRCVDVSRRLRRRWQR
jgi:hypothetical protein